MPHKSRCPVGYRFWYLRSYPFREADDMVIQYLGIENSSHKPFGWLRRAREALFLSSNHVAENLGCSQQSYSRIERDENVGAVKLSTLEKVAAAMDCELIYAIRPKAKSRFSQVIWSKLDEIVQNNRLVMIRRPPQHKELVAAAIARRRVSDPNFRREQNWSVRKPKFRE